MHRPVSRSSLDAVDDLIYSLIDSEAGGFTAAAECYEATVGWTQVPSLDQRVPVQRTLASLVPHF